MAASPLHGRRHELDVLTKRSQRGESADPQLVVLFGRRRVGKTFLLQHLARMLERGGHDVVYFAATRRSAGDQRADLCATLGIDHVAATWADVWTLVAQRARIRPLTLLLDEVPYLVESDASWPTTLQSAWDAVRHGAAPTALTIVLTGSAVSTMTNLVSSRGALFERPDQLIRLDPFDLPTAASFLGRDVSPIAAIEAYTACDGYPLLLDRWDSEAPARSNLERLAGQPVAPLAVNASTLLLDLDDVEATQRVLGAIGRGASRLGEIHNHAGKRPERPLDILERSGFIVRRRSIDDNRNRPPLIELADNYLRFWFALIEPKLQLIDGGQGAAVIGNAMTQWEHLVAGCFEREARRHAARRAGGRAVVGEWWTDRPQQAQIDVVEQAGNSWTMVGEVKWKDRFARADLSRFEHHLAVAGDRASSAALAVWSRLGVSDDVRTMRPDLSSFTATDVVADVSVPR